MHTCSKMEKKTKTIKKDLREEILIPEGISATLNHDILILKKDNEEILRKLNLLINIKIEGNKIILESKSPNKNKKRIFGTTFAHINNMIQGLTEKFKYKLQISNVHFPMTVKVDSAKNELIIGNFLGEKTNRIIKLVPGVSVKVTKEFIDIEDSNIERAGQCAANIEKNSKPKNKDRRIFQDGIYIIEKPGRVFL